MGVIKKHELYNSFKQLKTVAMLGSLNNQEILNVLQRQLYGRIGCCMDNIPYVVPVTYAYYEGCIYSHTEDGMKIDIMRKNPKVCFQVDEVKNLGNWKSVICQGEFEELKDSKQRDIGVVLLVNRNAPFETSEKTVLTPAWPFDNKNVGGIIFRIWITEKSGRFEVNVPAKIYAH